MHTVGAREDMLVWDLWGELGPALGIMLELSPSRDTGKSPPTLLSVHITSQKGRLGQSMVGIRRAWGLLLSPLAPRGPQVTFHAKPSGAQPWKGCPFSR